MYGALGKDVQHERIRTQCERTGQPLPEFVSEAPELSEQDYFYYSAYQALDSCRSFSSGGAAMRIPWTAIKEYANHHGIDYHNFELLYDVISEIDSAYTKEINRGTS